MGLIANSRRRRCAAWIVASLLAAYPRGAAAQDSLAHLIRALEDNRPSVRRDAAERIGKMGPAGASAAQALLAMIQREVADYAVFVLEARFEVADPAAEALGRMGPGVIPLLLTSLPSKIDHTEDLLAAYIGTALTGIGSSAVKPLAALAASESEPVPRRAYAAKALGKIAGAGQALPVLRRLLSSDHRELVIHAAFALGDMGAGAEAAVPDLARLLVHADKFFRQVAALTLGQIGPRAGAAAQQMGTLLSDPEQLVRIVGANSLARLGAAAAPALPALLQALNREWPAGADDRLPPMAVQLRIVEAIGNMGRAARSAAPLLRRMSDQATDPELRAAAQQALRRIDGD